MRYFFSLCFSTLLSISFSSQAQVQNINTIAGNGTAAFSGDGHSAIAASLYGPLGVAVDSAGDVFIEDYYNLRVRRVDARTHIITTIAGTGEPGYSGDGSYGADAQINPSGVAVSANGNVYISDAAWSVIRMVNAEGIISTIAGRGYGGYTGDSGAATLATFQGCQGIAFDNAGNLYVADMGNNVVRKIDTAGMVTTFAGDDTAGYAGDGGPAIAAKLSSPVAVAADYLGNIYITDFGNNVIRKVGTNDTITTYAGNNALTLGWSGDGGAATAAQLNAPRGIVADQSGSLYIADALNNVVRVVNASTGIISTAIGIGTPGFGGDLGPVTSANLFDPYGLAIDIHGNIYIDDANNERVRETYSPTEGVKNVSNSTDIAAYPNPFSEQLNISGLNLSDKFCLYDVLGRQIDEIYTANTNAANTVNLSSLTPGVYTMQVWNADGIKRAVLQVVKE